MTMTRRQKIHWISTLAHWIKHLKKTPKQVQFININPFLPNAPFLNLLQTSENRKVF